MSCIVCKYKLATSNACGICNMCKKDKALFIRSKEAQKKFALTEDDLTSSKIAFFNDGFNKYHKDYNHSRDIYYVKDILNLADKLTNKLEETDPTKKKYIKQLKIYNKILSDKKDIDNIYADIVKDVTIDADKNNINITDVRLDTDRNLRIYMFGAIKNGMSRNELKKFLFNYVKIFANIIQNIKKLTNNIVKKSWYCKIEKFIYQKIMRWFDTIKMKILKNEEDITDIVEDLEYIVSQRIEGFEIIENSKKIMVELRKKLSRDDMKYVKCCRKFLCLKKTGKCDIQKIIDQVKIMKNNDE